MYVPAAIPFVQMYALTSHPQRIPLDGASYALFAPGELSAHFSATSRIIAWSRGFASFAFISNAN